MLNSPRTYLEVGENEKMRTPKEIIAKLQHVFSTVRKLNERLDELQINQGTILSHLHAQKTSKRLQDYEFKVFSQSGEDGIIQRLVQSIEIENKTFIEFGVEDFSEANCRFLLMKDNWRGFVIDGSKRNIERLKTAYFYWKYQLEARAAFITKENINALLAESTFEQNVGILSIDLDGNDYHILSAIDFYKPSILICEYNAVFGAKRKISIPYQPAFQRTQAHHSNLYWGASLSAMTYLAEKKGYALVGTNTTSTNAFYVRKDLVTEKLEVLSAEQAHSSSHFRDSRDAQGNFTFIAGDKRLDVIKGLPVFDVENNVIDSL
ncbi:MAG: hypothetical protein JWQ07_5594 [Ramlibacter sp.]|nr:hypothetical protein [Ramlibacter sp.]